MEELRKRLREMTDKFVDDIVALTIQEGHKMAIARMREARHKARMNKGKIPYGEYPHEKDGLEMMIRMRREGHPFRTIGEAMERHGFPTRAGMVWNPGTIIRILKKYGVK